MKDHWHTVILATFCWLQPALPATARDLPDLVISKVELASTGDCTGKKPLISGTVHVKNIGLGRGQIFTTKVMLRSYVRERSTLSGGDRFVNSMRPGEVVRVEVRLGNVPSQGMSGRYTVVLEVDPENVFREEDERNNSATTSIELACG